MSTQISTLLAIYDPRDEMQTTHNCRCRGCGCEWAAITAYNADTSALECPKCGGCCSECEVVVTAPSIGRGGE